MPLTLPCKALSLPPEHCLSLPGLWSCSRRQLSTTIAAKLCHQRPSSDHFIQEVSMTPLSLYCHSYPHHDFSLAYKAPSCMSVFQLQCQLPRRYTNIYAIRSCGGSFMSIWHKWESFWKREISAEKMLPLDWLVRRPVVQFLDGWLKWASTAKCEQYYLPLGLVALAAIGK